ncbi:MAG: hypothetical protein P4L36_06475 [Holophaga sp.]|nr:hypothetical protein [Holophaga sp.]
MRSTLHDMANVLAGVKGILDLTLPGQPMTARDRQRLEAVTDEGITTLERCRFLAMAILPEGPMEPGDAWRIQLLEELEPMATLFRSRVELGFEGAPGWDQWPGKLLRGYVRAVTRQVMPYAKGGIMNIKFSAAPEEWRLCWSPAPTLPENLSPGARAETMDISARWAARTGASLGAALSCEAGALLARIPRQGTAPAPVTKGIN